MLDPKEQAKGGFRAQVARQQEQQAVIAAARTEADRAARVAVDTPASDSSDSSVTVETPVIVEWGPNAAPPSEPQAHGETTPYAPSSPYAPSDDRQPRRWR